MPPLLRRASIVAALSALIVAWSPALRADPAMYSVDLDTLDAALTCRGGAGTRVAPEDVAYLSTLTDDREPVLLVHGTLTNGEENYRWALAEALGKDGFSPCWVTYPNRGLDDMQVSAEFVVRAIERLASVTGRSVDVLGHSQGAILPRWAVRFWPGTARVRVDDLVLIAGPHHGTTAVTGYGLFGEEGRCQPQLCTEAMWQFDPDSRFITALNSLRETFDQNDVTSIYTQFDLLAQPTETSVLHDPTPASPNVANVLIQDVCPARPVDHAFLFIDHVMYVLATDAFRRDGPADPSRVKATDCLQGPFEGFDPLLGVQVAAEGFIEGRGFDHRPVDGEPPLKPYAERWGS